MQSSRESPLKSYDKNGFIINHSQQQALKYLIDSDAEQQRKIRWQELLPRIHDLKNGGKLSERQLIQHVRKGIDDGLRHIIWPMLIQKPLIPYHQCINKCQIKDINLDLQRTFPQHKQSKQIQSRMKQVLNALAHALPDVGYCQGMNFIVGTILLRNNNEETFNVAYHIFHWERHQELLKNLQIIHQKLFALDKLILKHYPQLYKHLNKYEVTSTLYASSWFITIFCNCLPASYTFRILQCLLLQGRMNSYQRIKSDLSSLFTIIKDKKENNKIYESNLRYCQLTQKL